MGPPGPASSYSLARGSVNGPGWTGTSYIWDDAQKVAQVSAGGQIVTLSFIDSEGHKQSPTYPLPQRQR
jgi:hypothetical protein